MVSNEGNADHWLPMKSGFIDAVAAGMGDESCNRWMAKYIILGCEINKLDVWGTDGGCRHVICIPRSME